MSSNSRPTWTDAFVAAAAVVGLGALLLALGSASGRAQAPALDRPAATQGSTANALHEGRSATPLQPATPADRGPGVGQTAATNPARPPAPEPDPLAPFAETPEGLLAAELRLSPTQTERVGEILRQAEDALGRELARLAQAGYDDAQAQVLCARFEADVLARVEAALPPDRVPRYRALLEGDRSAER